MIFVERGDLDLDAPVRRFLPKLALADDDVAARVTMRHLLTHTAGWVGDYFADHGPGDDALERMLGDLPRLPQLTPLGEVWSYNNAGFYIAGRVLEVLGGASYEHLVQTLLFEPLELEHSLFFAEDVMTRRFAVGHYRADDGPPTVARPWPIGRAHHAAGGVSSTVLDLVRYARFHLSDGEEVLTRASLDEMQRPQAAAAPIFGSVGLAWGSTTRVGFASSITEAARTARSRICRSLRSRGRSSSCSRTASAGARSCRRRWRASSRRWAGTSPSASRS
jgi:CubicO group peptidase (beta-lactamase class C family)